MTWLDHYMSYAAVNESPRSYHLWSGLSLVASIVGRRVYTDMRLFQVHPNLYVVLAGPPGVAKSTAMRVARDFVQDNIKTLPICPAAITKEALVKIMATEKTCIQQYNHEDKVKQYSQMSVFGDELVSLLTCGGNPTGMIEFVTEMFDSKGYRETTKGKGDHEIKEPFLNILICCTVETLKQLVNQKVVSGGASRRFVFIVERKNSKPVAEIEYSDAQIASKEFCAANWHHMRQQSGEFLWQPEAKQYYKKWYDENFYRVDSTTSQTLQHFLKTKPSYCIKISMLLAIAKGEKLIHSEQNFREAVRIVTDVEDGAQRLFDNDGRNEIVAIQDDVLDFIARQGEAKFARRRVYTAFFKHCKDGKTAELDALLEQLARLNHIRLFSEYNGSTSTEMIERLKA